MKKNKDEERTESMDNEEIIEEIREELQVVDDYMLRLNRFKVKLKVFLRKLESEDETTVS